MQTRRVVTGHDQAGKSVIKWDSELADKPGRDRFSRVDLWATKTLPVRLNDEDPAEWTFGTTVAGGCVFRICRYEPGVAERWHRTDSIDYAVIISGEIDMQVDAGEVHLKAGDVVVQQGTMHNWVNRGTAPCLIAFILIATEGGAATGW
jgi:mannose-6-phosphate isomerase-like protein (cupin superfamily)